MDYEGRICRPPMERASFMLPVMVGCSHNQCKFCNLFRDVKCRVLPVDKIEKELVRVKKLGGNLKNIFLGDGDAFSLSTEKLLYISELIRKYFPSYERINMDATVMSILQKSDAELEALYQARVCCLYIGIESGLDDVLCFMKKDHNINEAITAIEKLQRAGLSYAAHIMTGVAGKNRGTENAKSLATFFNKTQPKRIINFSMFLHNEVPLYEDIISNTFIPADELENLKEEKTLLEFLTVDKSNPIEYDGLHDFIKFRVRGSLPNDKEKMLLSLRNKISKYESTKSIYAYVYGSCTKELTKLKSQEKVWVN